MATSVYVPFRPVSHIKTFKFATFGLSQILLPWNRNRYFCGILFGINCTALDQSELSNFVDCTIKHIIENLNEKKLKERSAVEKEIEKRKHLSTI